jgi:hypothetical protein
MLSQDAGTIDFNGVVTKFPYPTTQRKLLPNNLRKIGKANIPWLQKNETLPTAPRLTPRTCECGDAPNSVHQCRRHYRAWRPCAAEPSRHIGARCRPCPYSCDHPQSSPGGPPHPDAGRSVGTVPTRLGQGDPQSYPKSYRSHEARQR